MIPPETDQAIGNCRPAADRRLQKKFTLCATFLIVRHEKEFFVINRSHYYGKNSPPPTTGRHSKAAMQLMIASFNRIKQGNP
jgi:hypothetical protein